MWKAGVDHTVLMKLTGHKTPSMFQRYNTVDREDARKAYLQLEKLLGRGPGAAGRNKSSHSAPEAASLDNPSCK
jgi:hypothetical protein